MNKEQWWKLVDDNWEGLLYIIHSFWENSTQLTITAPGAEAARQNILKDSPKNHVDFQALKENRSPELSRFLESVYWRMPESTDCWKFEAFGVLCDLCSESYCLYEEEEEESE